VEAAADSDKLAAFEEALYRANEVTNLTRVPREEFAVRHIADSLMIAEIIPTGAKVLDLGTGAGFPAWPLALQRPDLHVVAVDSNRKVLSVLESQPLPNLEVVCARAEELGRYEEFDFVTGRAVAPLPIQLEISAPFCKVGGLVVPMRGVNDDPESADYRSLGLKLLTTERRELPGTDVIRLFPIYLKAAQTPPKYPRRWAEIKSRPLVASRP
jgi:16S rRNA (guanine527-N7)-methyltransferase